MLLSYPIERRRGRFLETCSCTVRPALHIGIQLNPQTVGFASECLQATETRFLTSRKTKNSSSHLFSLRDGVFTAIEDVRSDHLLRLASTSEILWFDERSASRPLFGYKHGRQFDRSLSIQTVNLASAYQRSQANVLPCSLYPSLAPLTFLTTRRNGLVTVYDVSASHNNLLQINGAPHGLPNALNRNGTNIAQVVLQHPLHCKKDSTTLFRMNERGSIDAMDMNFIVDDDNSLLSECHRLDVRWSNDIRDMQRRAAELIPEVGPFDAQDIDEIDLQPVYDSMYCPPLIFGLS